MRLHFQALEFQPDDRPCLVERSKCYLQLGDMTAALADAEASLKDDKKYHRVSIHVCSVAAHSCLTLCVCDLTPVI